MFARYSRYPARCAGCSWTSSRIRCPRARRAGTDVEGERAAQLFERVFVGYGDDSVAQLGGAHIACEWVSNVLTKVSAAPAAGGVPGAVHALHRLRRADARRRLPLLPGRVAGSRVRGEHGLPVRHVRGVAPARERVGGLDVPGVARRVRGGAPARGQGQGAGPAARAAARRVAVAHGDLRQRPGVRAADPAPARAPAAGGADLRRADARGGQGRDAELRRARRALRSWRCLGRLSERAPGGRAALGVAARAGPGRGCRGAFLGPAHAHRRRRGAAARRARCSRPPASRTTGRWKRCTRWTRTSGRGCSRTWSASARTGATVRAAASRRCVTGSRSSPTMARSATSSATGCSPSSGSR